mgnify:CR=1 FL=1
MRNDDRAPCHTSARGQRLAWSPPRLTRFRAGEAEVGGNPINPEGAFATGS